VPSTPARGGSEGRCQRYRRSNPPITVLQAGLGLAIGTGSGAAGSRRGGSDCTPEQLEEGLEQLAQLDHDLSEPSDLELGGAVGFHPRLSAGAVRG